MRVALFICLGVGVIPIAIAGGHAVPAAYRNAAHAHQVPPKMLYALSLTESATTLSYGRRPWPWTLNIAGRGERYASRAAACQTLTTALTHTKIVDVGISQLNVHWQRALFGTGGRFADPCTALNPYANLDAAASILHRCHQRIGGSWVAAAGCYHRPAGGAPAARYRQRFRQQLAAIGDGLTTPPAGGHTVATRRSAPTPTPDTRSVHAAQVTWIDPSTEHETPHALD